MHDDVNGSFVDQLIHAWQQKQIADCGIKQAVLKGDKGALAGWDSATIELYELMKPAIERLMRVDI